MATASSVFSLDQFLCYICLEVFTDPVSTPCGHNFCKTCIAALGASSDQSQCPVCRETLDGGHTLRVNTGLRDLAELFKRMRSSEETCPAKPGEVPCDVCAGTKLKAQKSCLVCLASYCQAHLEPHGRVQALKRHRLLDPMGNLEDRVCQQHNRPKEFFCSQDQTCVCVLCLRDDHVTHETVSCEEELAERKAKLDRINTEVKKQVQNNLLQVQKANRSVTKSRNATKKATEDMAEVFSSLVASVKASHAELVSAVQGRQRYLEEKTLDFITDLELETAELHRRSKEIEQHSNTKNDLLLLLQNPFPPSMPTPSPSREMPEVFPQRDPIMDRVRQTITQQKETFSKDMKRVVQDIKLYGTGAAKEAEREKVCLGQKTEQLFEDQLLKIQKLYAVDVTLDPDTANPFLVVSTDRKLVRDEGVQRYFPYNQKRFKFFKYVTGKEGFSSNFYYEVHVNGLMYWDVGVVSESIIGNEQNLTASQKSWAVCLIQGFYYANSKPPANIYLTQKPQRIGVFVDYKECQVSFYNVDSRTLIYSFTGCMFKQGSHRLLPLIGVSRTADKRSSSPLTITPVTCGTKR